MKRRLGKFARGSSAVERWRIAVLVAALGLSLGAGHPAMGQSPAAEVRRFDHASHIYQILFSPDGKLVVTDDQVWEAATGNKVATLPLPALDRRPFVSFSLAFSPDGRHVAVHRYLDIVLAEAATGKEVWKVDLAKRGPVRQRTPRLVFSSDGDLLFSARNDEGLVRVWSVATGKELRSFAFDTVGDGQNGVDVLSLGAYAERHEVVVHSAISSHAGNVSVIDYESGKMLRQHRVGSKDAWINDSALSPTGDRLAYASDNVVHLLDVKTGEELRTLTGVGRYLFLPAFSPDNTHIAASIRAPRDEEDWIGYWDSSSGKSIGVIEKRGRISQLVYSPDGKHVLSASEDGVARLWRLGQ